MAPRRSWAKANNSFWSKHVAAWYRSALEAEHYCRKHDLSTTSLMRRARHLLSADDLRKRAEHLRNLRQKASKWQHNNEPSKRQEPLAISLRRADGQRSDCPSGVLEHACRSHELLWHGAYRIFRGVRSLTAFPAHLGAIPWSSTPTKWTGVPCFIEVPGRN